MEAMTATNSLLLFSSSMFNSRLHERHDFYTPVSNSFHWIRTTALFWILLLLLTQDTEATPIQSHEENLYEKRDSNNNQFSGAKLWVTFFQVPALSFANKRLIFWLDSRHCCPDCPSLHRSHDLHEAVFAQVGWPLFICRSLSTWCTFGWCSRSCTRADR